MTFYINWFNTESDYIHVNWVNTEWMKFWICSGMFKTVKKLYELHYDVVDVNMVSHSMLTQLIESLNLRWTSLRKIK
jgi:hypothetical protein